MQANGFVKSRYIWGCFLLLFLIRCYHLTAPIVDHQSWNQVSAAAMAKHLYLDWSTFWKPTVDMYGALGDDSRVYAQEFMLYQIPVAALYEVFGVTEWPGRLVSIAFGLLGLWYWFRLTQSIWGDRVALVAVFIAGISPLNWYYHRAILSDNGMVTAMIAGCYYFYCWLEHQDRTRYLVGALIWTMIAGLFKPFGLIILVGYLLWIVLRRDFALLKQPRLYVLGILAWVPSGLWIYHVLNLSEGITEFTDANSMNQIRHPELLLTAKFYSRIIFARLIDQLLTPWAALFAIIGMVGTRWRDPRYHLPMIWMGSMLLYLIIVQRGNYTHDYYQLLFVPGLALYAAIGVEKVWGSEKLSKWVKTGWMTLFLVLFLAHSTKYAYNHFQMNEASYVVGRKVAEFSQNPEDRVLSWDRGAGNHNQLVYYTERTGWYFWNPSLDQLERYRDQGATWLAVVMRRLPEYERHQALLDSIESVYPKVWESHKMSNRYDEPVVAFIYDLRD